MDEATATVDREVVIVGAGPVGLVLALLLARRGRSSVVVERQQAPYPLPRAVALSDESMRVLQNTGALDELRPFIETDFERSVVGTFIDAEHNVLMTAGFPDASLGWPVMSGFSQPDVEARLEAHCERSPLIDLRRGWAATAISQHADGVTVTIHRAEGSRLLDGDDVELTALFAVGADGANSTVRELVGGQVHDEGFFADWLVVDVVPDTAREWDPWLGQSLDPRRPTTLVPSGPGKRRFEFMCLPGEVPDVMNDPDTAWQLLERWDVHPGNASLVRHAVYSFRARWAENWRIGRVLLAGDAAHQMPPLGAQGLNSGLRDVAALVWRLDLAIAGVTPLDALDTYTSERLGHVIQIIEQAVRMGHIVCVTDPIAAAERDQMLRAMSANPELAPPPPALWRLGPGLAVPDDPMAGYLAIQGRVEHDGRTGLFDDVVGAGRFVLISAAADPFASLGPAARTVVERLGILTVHVAADGPVRDLDGTYRAWFDRHGIEVALVRPDFYVFGTSPDADGADGLVEQLAEQLGLRPGTAAGGTRAGVGIGTTVPM